MLHNSLSVIFSFALSPMVAQVDYQYSGPETPVPLNQGPGVKPGQGGFQGAPPGAPPGFPGGPGFSSPFPGGPNRPGPFQNNPPAPPGVNPGPPAGPGLTPPPPTEFRIEFRQPEWREQTFSAADSKEQADKYADTARELGYEVHLEHYRDRSRVAYRMIEWMTYATLYRQERAQQLRAWLESQGLETRVADPRPPVPPTPSTPPPAQNGLNGPGPFGGPRFSFDPSVGKNGIPQAW